MNWQELVSHRRLNRTDSTRRQGSHAFGETTRPYFNAQKVKTSQTSRSTCRNLGTLRASPAESLPLLQKPKEGEHHLLRAVSAGGCRTPVTEGFSSLSPREILQSDLAKCLELETRRGCLTNPKEAWTEKTHEATAPLGTQGKDRTTAFLNQANDQGDKPQSPQVQLHKDLWKDVVMKYSIASPRKGLHMVSHCPKPEGSLEGHVLEGKKILLKSRPPVQETHMHSLEGSQEEETQTPKKEKAKKRAKSKEREAQSQFSKEKSLLQKKLWELSPVPVRRTSLLNKKKTQALEPSPKNHHHHPKSGPRAHKQNLQQLAQDGHIIKVTKEQSKTEKRKSRTKWWDPTVWGAPVTLAKREQSPQKNSEFSSDRRKRSFPMGRSSSTDQIPTGRATD